MSGVLLYSASKQAGVNFPPEEKQEGPVIVEDAFDVAARAARKERTFDDYIVDLYDKVGGYYGLSFLEFMDMPYSMIKRLNAKIDERIESIEEGGFYNSTHIAVYLAIAKAFGGK